MTHLFPVGINGESLMIEILDVATFALVVTKIRPDVEMNERDTKIQLLGSNKLHPNVYTRLESNFFVSEHLWCKPNPHIITLIKTKKQLLWTSNTKIGGKLNTNYCWTLIALSMCHFIKWICYLFNPQRAFIFKIMLEQNTKNVWSTATVASYFNT